MADSWEDEEFDVPSAVPPTSAPVSWEDEEEDQVDSSTIAPGVAPKMSAAKAAKSVAEKEARIAAELEARLQVGETAEQRRLRERNRVEEADNNLTEDLFGGAAGGGRGGGGLSSVPLKSMQDHVKLAIELSEIMDASKPAHMAAFLKEMVTNLSKKMTTDGMTDLFNHTNVFLDEKRQADERIATAKANATNVQAIQRANKKKTAKKKKAHSDVFGGDFDGDNIDGVGMDYESKYDDFM